MLSGFLQVVASACRLLYPGGRGVGGWGAARIEPTKSKVRYEISPPKYRSVVLTLVKARSILTAPSAWCQRSIALCDCSVVATTVAVAPVTRAKTTAEKIKSFRMTTPVLLVDTCQAIRVGHVIVITGSSKGAISSLVSFV